MKSNTKLWHQEDNHRSQMLWTLDLCCVAIATLPNQKNNKRRIQPNGKKFINNAIQIIPDKPNDSNPVLYELFPAKQGWKSLNMMKNPYLKGIYNAATYTAMQNLWNHPKMWYIQKDDLKINLQHYLT